MNNRIKELAEQAWDYVDAHCPYASEEQEMFEKKFAELIAAAEREACAKVCDGIDRRYINQADKCAAAIRARNE